MVLQAERDRNAARCCERRVGHTKRVGRFSTQAKKQEGSEHLRVCALLSVTDRQPQLMLMHLISAFYWNTDRREDFSSIRALLHLYTLNAPVSKACH